MNNLTLPILAAQVNYETAVVKLLQTYQRKPGGYGILGMLGIGRRQ